ncbi:hypothetical protein A8M56_06380 [Yersinia pestis]|nr:hypothetical protein A8M56_06380 [Yersinia pestis]
MIDKKQNEPKTKAMWCLKTMIVIKITGDLLLLVSKCRIITQNCRRFHKIGNNFAIPPDKATHII